MRTRQHNPKLCDDCRGSCCKHPWIDTPADEVYADLVAECLAVRTREGPCPKLGPDGRCTIYATRPFLCRVAIAGDDTCRMIRRKFGVDCECGHPYSDHYDGWACMADGCLCTRGVLEEKKRDGEP